MPLDEPMDWVREDIPHEGDYAHVNAHGDVEFRSRSGRCEYRIPYALLPSFRAWMERVGAAHLGRPT